MMQYYCSTQPDRARVLHYYDEMVKAGVTPSSHSYNILMTAYSTIDPPDFTAMNRVFDTIKQQPPNSDSALQGLHWATLINAYGSVGKSEST